MTEATTSDDAELEQWLAGSDHHVTLVLTDVVASTALLFDAQTLDFRRLMRLHRARTRELARECGGRLLDQSGDASFTAFAEGTQALRFALGLVHDSGHAAVRIRAGAHFGRVQADEGRLVGRSVHLAARVREHAGAGELWVSDALKQAAGPGAALPAGARWGGRIECELKGIPDRQILWQIETAASG